MYKRTYTARALEEHKMIHRSDYFFECNICHVKYKSEDNLKRHNMRIHSNYELKYICEYCSYKLKTWFITWRDRTPQSYRFVDSAERKWKMWRHMNGGIRNVTKKQNTYLLYSRYVYFFSKMIMKILFEVVKIWWCY